MSGPLPYTSGLRWFKLNGSPVWLSSGYHRLAKLRREQYELTYPDGSIRSFLRLRDAKVEAEREETNKDDHARR